MKKATQYLMVLLFFGLIVSCSDDDKDDTTDEDNKVYFPLASGSNWTYAKSEIQADGSMNLVEYERQEVAGEEMIDGHSTYSIETYVAETPSSFGMEPASKTNYYNDNGKLWASVSYLEQLLTVDALGIQFPLNTDVKFIKLLDANVDSWTAIEIPYDKFDIEALGFQIQFTGKATYKVKRLGEKDYVNSELNIDNKVMAYEYEFELAGNTTLFSAPFGNINIKTTSEQWFMPGVGLVRRIDNEVEVSGDGGVGAALNDLPNFPANHFELYQYSVEN